MAAPFARGQGTFVSPQQLSTVAGNAGGFIGLQSFQQIYAGSQFSSSIHNPIFIMAFSYRIDETFPAALSAVIPKLEIIMSTSLRPITQMIANRALNRGPIQQVVFSHENFPVSGRLSTGGQPAPFDIKFNLDTPYAYDPANGQLVVDFTIRPPDFGDTPRGDGQNYASSDAPARLVVSSGPFEDRILDFGFVTEITYRDVPEPTVTILVVLGGIMGLMLGTIKRK
jgi:hypothetical protein